MWLSWGCRTQQDGTEKGTLMVKRVSTRPRSRFTAGGRGVGRIFRRLGSIVAQNHRKLRERGRRGDLWHRRTGLLKDLG